MLVAARRPARSVRTESDGALVARIRARDDDAFAEVYDRHGAGLLSFCRHLLGSLDEAEDAVQQTFISAHRALLADRREIHLKAWLYAIARNRCLSALRARRELTGLDDALERAPSTAGLSAEVERREDLRALLGDLARLPDSQRAALVLAELGDHSHDEIADVLGVQQAKVRALVFQARESLAAARTARETPCAEIREQLATARGGSLRRGHLRRHVEVCEGCRAFRREVQRQRAAMAFLLPVTPSVGLKETVLAGGSATAVGGGVAATTGTAGVAVGAKAVTAKVLTAVLIGGAGGTGYVAVHGVPPDKPAQAAAEEHRAYQAASRSTRSAQAQAASARARAEPAPNAAAVVSVDPAPTAAATPLPLQAATPRTPLPAEPSKSEKHGRGHSDTAPKQRAAGADKPGQQGGRSHAAKGGSAHGRGHAGKGARHGGGSPSPPANHDGHADKPGSNHGSHTPKGGRDDGASSHSNAPSHQQPASGRQHPRKQHERKAPKDPRRTRPLVSPAAEQRRSTGPPAPAVVPKEVPHAPKPADPAPPQDVPASQPEPPKARDHPPHQKDPAPTSVLSPLAQDLLEPAPNPLG